MIIEPGIMIAHGAREFKIIRHIGKGKGGNSWLAEYGARQVVFKEMHYEPCNTYAFQRNKLDSELCDYARLKSVGIAMPGLICHDDARQFLVKEYVDGKTVAELVAAGLLEDDIVRQMFTMCEALYAANLNIDYFPTNFVVEGGRLYYIDYECNVYMQEWDFESWGIWFWANTAGMARFLETGDHAYLSVNAKPHKMGLAEIVAGYLSLKEEDSDVL
ncbi:MAG: hypothetical protein FWF10_06330 [Clostridiales bacterium]|nr:hypothetical protein [Clostridiales bacterium]